MSSHPKGATLIETVTRPILDEMPGDSPLDKVTVQDGFYRIVQYDEDGSEIDASFDAAHLEAYGTYESYSMVMSGSPEPTGRTFTRQWGAKNGFTIVPKDTPGEQGPIHGCSVYSIYDNPMTVYTWSSYKVWLTRCDESRTYRLEDGSVKTLYYFRILPRNSGHNWWTIKDKQPWRMGVCKTTWDPINPMELYQFIPAALWSSPQLKAHRCA